MRKNFSIWPQNLCNLHKSIEQAEGKGKRKGVFCVRVCAPLCMHVQLCVCVPTEIACDNGEIMDYAKLLSADDALTVPVDPVGEIEESYVTRC